MVALVENEAAFGALTPAQQRAVECEVRDAKLSGVALDGDEKTRYNEIAKELSALSTEFSNNVLDATKAFEHLCEAKDDVAGLPTSALEQAAQTAKSRGGHENATAEEGPWMFTLDAPSYMAVRSHAENRALREKVYRAYLARRVLGFRALRGERGEEREESGGQRASDRAHLDASPGEGQTAGVRQLRGGFDGEEDGHARDRGESPGGHPRQGQARLRRRSASWRRSARSPPSRALPKPARA